MFRVSAQRDEEVCYSAPVITRRNVQLDRGYLREKETVYADVRTRVTEN